jgi:hypothetical protein
VPRVWQRQQLASQPEQLHQLCSHLEQQVSPHLLVCWQLELSQVLLGSVELLAWLAL